MAYKRRTTSNETSEESAEFGRFELGSKKFVTVSSFNGRPLVDIREYYQDKATGESKPGRKGIALTEEIYRTLMELRPKIDDSLKEAKLKSTKQARVEKDEASSNAKKEAKKEVKSEEKIVDSESDAE